MTDAPLVLFGGTPEQREPWGEALRAAAARLNLRLRLVLDPAEVAPEAVDVLIYNPEAAVRDVTPYVNLRAVLSMWAGVETIVGDARLHAPLARMVEHGLTEGMTDWVVAHVARHHVGLDRHLALGPAEWPQDHPPLARDRRVGVLGLGALGADAASALAGLRFDVAGWSRTPKSVAGVDCRHGLDALDAVLARSEILVLLLPLTAGTENLMNAARLARLPRGAVLINPGRGALVDDDALLAALNSGHLAHATLDVFREEPLPEGHAFRRHPKVTVTPHVASVTRPETAAQALVEQIGRIDRGEPLLHVVDRARGY